MLFATHPACLDHLAGRHHPELLEEPPPGTLGPWDRAKLRLAESLRLLTHADGEHPAVARLHRLAGEFLRQSAQQAGDETARREAVEDFIDRRCAQAERDHRAQLAPWERTVLLADLGVRVARDDSSPEMARSLGVLIDVLRSFADVDTAQRLALLQHVAFQRHVTARPNDPASQRDLSVALEKLGGLAVDRGDLAGALRYANDAKTIRQHLAARNPADAVLQRDLFVSLERIGELALAHCNLDGALRNLAEANTIAERHAASDTTNSAWQYDLSLSLNKLGRLALSQGDLATAMRHFNKVKVIRESLVASTPTNKEWQRALAQAHCWVGTVHQRNGEFAKSEESFNNYKGIMDRLAASDPANATWQRDLSVSLNRLGDLAVAQGDLIGAIRHFTQDMAIAERLAASDPTNAKRQRDLWVSYWRLADHCERSSQPSLAKTWWKRAYDTLAGMKQRGWHVSPQDERFLERLRIKASGG